MRPVPPAELEEIPEGRIASLWLLPAVAILLAVFTYAMGESNGVFRSVAESGMRASSPHVVREVHYHLDPADPRRIDAVTFSLDRPPDRDATVSVRLDSRRATSYRCTATGVHIACPTLVPRATVVSVDALEIGVSRQR